jgi:membrane protein
VALGAVVATFLWLLSSLGFSAYVADFGSYTEAYGTVGTVVVLLLWFWLSAFVIIIGADLNAEIEHQTSKDSTVGPSKPLGERGAYVADHEAPVP